MRAGVSPGGAQRKGEMNASNSVSKQVFGGDFSKEGFGSKQRGLSSQFHGAQLRGMTGLNQKEGFGSKQMMSAEGC